jgi:outer membrane lipoprotein-sorting protein
MTNEKFSELMKQTYRAMEPSAAARHRLAEQAVDSDRRRAIRVQYRRRIRLSLGVAGGVLTAVALFLLMPVLSLASLIRSMESSLQDVQSAHVVTYTLGDGDPVVSNELWYQQGLWRLERNGASEITISDGRDTWVHLPMEKMVVFRPGQGTPYRRPPKGFGLTALVAEMTAHGWTDEVKIEREGKLKKLTIRPKNDPTVQVLWVNPETDLPVKGELYSKTLTGLRLEQTLKFAFNRDLAPELFAADFPDGTRVVHEASDAAAWEKRLSTVLATIGTNDEVEIRDLQVNSDGHVFLLYTNTGTTHSGNLSLRDSIGTVYRPGGTFQPYLGSTTGEKVGGFEVDGMRLDGAWWVPIQEQSRPWKSRTLTVSVEKVWWEPDPKKMLTWPKGEPVTPEQMIKHRKSLGDWTQELASPTCARQPEYMPFIGIGPTREYEYTTAENNARFRYHLEKGAFAKAEGYLRSSIAAIEAYERQSGQRFLQTDSFFDMYKVLKAQGKIGEARLWLRRTLTEPEGYNGPDAELEQALKAEGLR